MVISFLELKNVWSRTKMKLVLLLLMFVAMNTKAQVSVDLGVQGYYNFASLSHGLGVRAPINISNKVEAVPIFNYTLPSSEVQEFSAMLFGHYAIINDFGVKRNGQKLPVVYVIAGAGYLKWINFVAGATNSKAVENNLVINLGAGLNYPIAKKLDLFVDLKLNPVWMESYSEVGLRFNTGKRRNKELDCPKIL